MIKIKGLKNSFSLQKIALVSIFTAFTCAAQAATVNYTLDSIFSTGGQQLTGAFQWDFSEGDFENGTGTFSELFIPGHGSDIAALNITFDIGSSIEFSLAANLHNAGVDVTLFLVDPLTPTSGSLIDLGRSKWAIGGGFNQSDTSGTYMSGGIFPVQVNAIPLPAAAWLFGSGILGLIGVSRRRRK